MSAASKPTPYVYQSHAALHREHWAAGRIYAVLCENELTTIEGLTKAEAKSVCQAMALHAVSRSEEQK